MKTRNLFLVLLVALFTTFISCTNNQQPVQQSSPVQVTVNASQTIGDNLNLQALGELIKSCSNPQEIEQKLNSDGFINNLDLDGDGNRDYLKVTEFGQGNDRGYSITDVQKDGEPEVATININTQNQTVVLNGNPQYYGNMNNSYQSSFTTTDFLLLTWMMQHNSYYHSPYHYGHYGYGYGLRPIVPYHVYHSNPYVSKARTQKTYRTTTTTTTHIKSPNHNNSSNSVKNRVNLSKPTHTQKEFKSRDNSQPIRSGGFNNKPSNSKPSSSWGHSSPKRSSGHSSGHSSGSRRK